ncbi:MAG TPA: YqcC family protein [Candidatus Gracilibacteria bacterium]|nr:YqcC family protein [Candidatus Gracilibacteria bacterium]
MDIYQRAAEKITKIENELKKLGRWQATPLPAEKFENMGAFGINTMALEQWLQFVLIPRVNDIVQTRGDFPKGSAVGVYAIRNLDGDPEAEGLLQLLIEFDALFN